jgi:hypothetical protein
MIRMKAIAFAIAQFGSIVSAARLIAKRALARLP